MRSPRLLLLPILLIVVLLAGSLSARAQEPPPDRRSDGEKARDYAKAAPDILKSPCRTQRVQQWIAYLDLYLPIWERAFDSEQQQNTNDVLARRVPPEWRVREAHEFGEALPTLRKTLEDLKRLPPCETKVPQTQPPPGGGAQPLPPRVAHRTTTCDNPDCRYWAAQYNEAADNYALARGAGPPEAAASYRAQMQEAAQRLDQCERRCRGATLTVPAPSPATPPTPAPSPTPAAPGPPAYPFGESIEAALAKKCRTPRAVELIEQISAAIDYLEKVQEKEQREITDEALAHGRTTKLDVLEAEARSTRSLIAWANYDRSRLEALPPCPTLAIPASPYPGPHAFIPLPAEVPNQPAPLRPQGAMAPLVPGAQFYAGFTGGGASGRSQVKQPGEPSGETSFSTPDPTSKEFGLSGGLAGGLFGIEMQSGQWRFGAESDIAGGSVSGRTTAGCGVPCRTSNHWLATVRGRAGFDLGLATPYVTGGLAVGDVNARIGALPGGSTVAAGWSAGAGLQWPLAALGLGLSDAVTGRLEWLHVDLGNPRVCGPKSCGGPTHASFSSDIFRLGIAIPLSSLLPR